MNKQENFVFLFTSVFLGKLLYLDESQLTFAEHLFILEALYQVTSYMLSHGEVILTITY